MSEKPSERLSRRLTEINDQSLENIPMEAIAVIAGELYKHLVEHEDSLGGVPTDRYCGDNEA